MIKMYRISKRVTRIHKFFHFKLFFTKDMTDQILDILAQFAYVCLFSRGSPFFLSRLFFSFGLPFTDLIWNKTLFRAFTWDALIMFSTSGLIYCTPHRFFNLPSLRKDCAILRCAT